MSGVVAALQIVGDRINFHPRGLFPAASGKAHPLPLVQKILHWRHTGFSVHSKVRAETSEAERV